MDALHSWDKLRLQAATYAEFSLYRYYIMSLLVNSLLYSLLSCSHSMQSFYVVTLERRRLRNDCMEGLHDNNEYNNEFTEDTGCWVADAG